MTDPDETLSAIDAAIEGWNGHDGTVSDDAMRWAPEAPEREWRGAEPSITITDEVHHWGTTGSVFEASTGSVFMGAPDGTWTNIGYMTDDGADLGDLEGGEDNSRVWLRRRVPRTVTLTVAPDVSGFVDHVRRQGEVLMRAFGAFATEFAKSVRRSHATLAPLTYGDGYRRHRRTCRACNPAGNPKPLKVDGREYTRRRKNRRRRGR